MSTNLAAPAGRPSALHDRFQALNTRVNTPMQCECGSTHFYVVRAEEFADNGYSSAQIRSLSTNTEALYICVCGRPVTLKDTSQGKNADGPRARFLKSLGAAIEFQKQTSLKDLAKGFISIECRADMDARTDELAEKVEWLMEAVDHLKNKVDELGGGDDSDGDGEGVAGDIEAALEPAALEPDPALIPGEPGPVPAEGMLSPAPVLVEKPQPVRRTGRKAAAIAEEQA